jgi:5-methylcytosine-specific restriction endonuclease McrA
MCNNVVKINSIPKCEVPGCNKIAQNLTGGENPGRRKSSWIRERYGVENGWCCSYHHTHRIATELNGYESITAFSNSRHPYLKYRKDYCENVDGRLGFKCTYSSPSSETLLEMGLTSDFKGWLQVDHIDGNHTNNDESNLQTLCACCHSIKTFQAGDYATPGRKTRNRYNKKV